MNEETTAQEATEATQETPKTYTEEEVRELIQKEGDRRVTEEGRAKDSRQSQRS